MTAQTAAQVESKARVRTKSRPRGRLTPGRQILLQLVCLGIALTVLFPIVWIVGMSLDPRNIARPDSIIPPGASLDAYAKVLARPTLNPVSFLQLALNSFFIAVVIAGLSVGLGILAAYAFSRLHFRGRERRKALRCPSPRHPDRELDWKTFAASGGRSQRGHQTPGEIHPPIRLRRGGQGPFR
jgi:arabinogalactan oligomer/maltooligosaccharide transport system permease protein